MGRMHALDVELEVVRRQMEAALRLSEDKSLAKNVRRKHRQSYHDTHRRVGLQFCIDATHRRVGLQFCIDATHRRVGLH